MPANALDEQVAGIREASRRLVRELGFMHRHVAGTDLSPSAVHAIVEIGADERLTPKALGELLLLEKSTVSRLVASLVAKSLVAVDGCSDDARSKRLSLTPAGRRTLATIDRYAERRVSRAIAPLDITARRAVEDGLTVFWTALQRDRVTPPDRAQDAAAVTPADDVSIALARPSELRAVGRLMAEVYAELDGFPSREEQPSYYRQFERLRCLVETPGTVVLVARGADRAPLGGVVYYDDMRHYGAGGVACARLPNTAGLRLLAVAPEARGRAIGRRLTLACIERARAAGRSSVVLHTTRFMPIAWQLYERMGFARSRRLDFVQDGLDVFGFRLSLS